MGKRRQELDHKTREQMEQETDEEDEIVEENYEREPLRQDQLINIQSRKKLIAKRRVNDSTTASSKPSPFTPFSVFTSTTKPTEFNLAAQNASSGDSNEEKPSVFAGFKGFGAMKPATDTSIFTSKTTEAPKLSSLANGNGSTATAFSNGITHSAPTAGFSFSNKTTTQAATTNGEEKTKITVDESNSNLNNINDKELLFLSDLNDLYQRHYGNDFKRSYKLPSDSLINGNLHKDENSHDSSASTETKYAFLLSELNKHCSKWISKHVEESPLVILTPIFIDYFNYLILLEKHFYPTTFTDKTKLNKNSILSSTNLINGASAKLNGNSEAITLVSNAKPVLEEKTTNKQLNGHQLDKDPAKKYDEIDLTDEKTLNDSSKTFASFMNKSAQSQPFNSIKLAQLSSSTTSASSIIESSPSKSNNLFSFNKVKSDDKPLNKSDDTITPSVSSGSLFKFGSNSGSSSSSTSSVSSNLSSAAETSPSQKEVTLKKDFSTSSNTDSNATTITTNSESFKPNLFSNSLQATSLTPSFKFGMSSTSNSSVSATETASTTPSLFNLTTNTFKRSNETSDSVTKNQNEASPSKITKEDKNETPSTTTTTATTTASNFFSFLNKPVSSTSTETKPTETTTTSSKPFTGFDSFKPSAGAGGSSNFFTSITNNSAATSSNLLGSNGNAATPTTNSTAPAPFFSFQSNLNANNKTNSLFGNSTFGGSSVFGSATTSFGSSGNANEGGDADDEPYEPPKPEVSDVKEEGSVFEKRLKLFFYSEKEKKFTDRGVGNLYLKPINDGKDTQLIIRADNSLANILLNVKLNKMFPISKEGTKNVSYLCMPNPPIPNVSSDVPCKFLFKVKTDEDASELFDKLNELKR